MSALLAGLAFTTPLALAGLLVLPVIWWLLRFTPPKPQQVRFPPYRLLLDLISREEQPQHTPWWVLLMRLAMAAAVILGVAGPLLNASDVRDRSSDPLLIIADDSWASAPDWQLRQKLIRDLLTEAQRAGAPTAITGTTGTSDVRELNLADAATTQKAAAVMQPNALSPKREALGAELANAFSNVEDLRVLWLSDGLADSADGEFATLLGTLGGGSARVEVLLPDAARIPSALNKPELEASRLKLSAQRADGGDTSTQQVTVRSLSGRALAEAPLVFAAGQTSASAIVELPLELRNEASRIEITNGRSASGIYLFDDRWRRKSVAMLSGASQELEQPLLSPLYYVSRAIQPSAEITEVSSVDGIQGALKSGTSMMVLADIGVLGDSNVTALEQWVDNGGVVVRFAGPRLAGGHDGLVPVELRSGGRSLGSALSWEQPQGLAPFAEETPFAGLATDTSIKVTRQVLAEPSATLPGLVWASLEDGTPLVTARAQGKGLVVLFHVTANADWSNLPLTGLFVEMLKRIADIAPAAGSLGTDETGSAAANASAASSSQGAFTPLRTLNGFGELTTPPASAAP
ncbi:MAG: BatA domain-containing protein, partial [Anderseniella sp.]